MSNGVTVAVLMAMVVVALGLAVVVAVVVMVVALELAVVVAVVVMVVALELAVVVAVVVMVAVLVVMATVVAISPATGRRRGACVADRRDEQEKDRNRRKSRGQPPLGLCPFHSYRPP